MNGNKLKLQPDRVRIRGSAGGKQTLPNIIEEQRLGKAHKAGSVLRASKRESK
jgi:hypothetical protein